jgi:hypothetical protein
MRNKAGCRPRLIDSPRRVCSPRLQPERVSVFDHLAGLLLGDLHPLSRPVVDDPVGVAIPRHGPEIDDRLLLGLMVQAERDGAERQRLEAEAMAARRDALARDAFLERELPPLP